MEFYEHATSRDIIILKTIDLMDNSQLTRSSYERIFSRLDQRIIHSS